MQLPEYVHFRELVSLFARQLSTMHTLAPFVLFSDAKPGKTVCYNPTTQASPKTDLTTVPIQHTTESIISIFDCSDVTGSTGVYTLLGGGASHPLPAKDVYCDMTTAGGG